MKYIYLTLFTLLTGAAFGQFGQVANGGFENWTNATLYDYPTQWGNTNTDEFYGIPTVVKSTDAQDGSYSIELRGVEVGQAPDTIFGYCFHGDPNFAFGIPYSAQFDEVQVYYKSDIAVGDSAYLVLQRYVGGVPQPQMIMPIIQGTQAAWTMASLSIPAGTQDSLWIGFVIGNPFIGEWADPGSWVRLDNVKLLNSTAATPDLPDHSFEDWTALAYESADDWYSTSEWLAGIGMENVLKTIDANTGSFAAELTTVDVPTEGDTIPGILSIGAIDFGNIINPFAAIPYTAVPTNISGAYKYTPAPGDGAGLFVEFWASGSMIGSHTEIFTTQATYTTFSAPLVISGIPDSMNLYIYSGDFPGSVLKIDDLSLTGGDVGLNEFASMNVNIYPNPASETVMLKAEGNYAYTVLDLAGNVIMTDTNVTGPIELSIGHLASGTYLVRINNDQNSETQKLMVK
ncbi:MAG: hypothetical protein ACI837_003268 [Crocinitomicaceae bacterium]|jgi:hypothetical protein